MIWTIIITVAIPFIVQLLKKIKLPSKFAPIAAMVIAVIFVAVGKWVGLDLNVKDIYQAILLALGIAGASVLGYDTVTKLMEPPAK
jgi:hypothetical protein